MSTKPCCRSKRSGRQGSPPRRGHSQKRWARGEPLAHPAQTAGRRHAVAAERSNKRRPRLASAQREAPGSARPRDEPDLPWVDVEDSPSVPPSLGRKYCSDPGRFAVGKSPRTIDAGIHDAPISGDSGRSAHPRRAGLRTPRPSAASPPSSRMPRSRRRPPGMCSRAGKRRAGRRWR